MKPFLRILGVVCGLLLAGYVGSFVVLVQTGLAYGRSHGLSHAYFLADPASDPGYTRHYQRGRFYFPLVYVLQHWTHGPYFVYAH